jgi:hypothetical protein
MTFSERIMMQGRMAKVVARRRGISADAALLMIMDAFRANYPN